MTAELSDWLADLVESQPATAAEVGAALVALLECAEPADLVAVGKQAGTDPRESVDAAYQRMLADLQLMRRLVAEAAFARQAAGQHLSARQADGADSAELAALEAELTAAGQREAQLARRCRMFQGRADAFRAAKETAKATYTAADAQVRIAEALADAAEFEESAAETGEEFTAAAAADADSVRSLEAVRTAEARLRELTGRQQAGAAPVPGLFDLNADPLGTGARVLFAVEPADTVTLLAVLEGPQAVGEYGTEALRLAGELLTEIREHGWPADLDPVLVADPDAFRTRYFPADDGSIARRAAVLAGLVPLARLREDQGLTVAQVAARSGLSANRIAAIERHGLRAARVHEAVALARALGARLELPGGDGAVAG